MIFVQTFLLLFFIRCSFVKKRIVVFLVIAQNIKCQVAHLSYKKYQQFIDTAQVANKHIRNG